jgi:hypothetical protein
MTTPRQKLISEYVIDDPNLQALLDALCEKQENKQNLLIIRKALKGVYAEEGDYEGCLTLYGDLNKAGYLDLAERATRDDYTYDFAPKPSPSHPHAAAATAIRTNQEIEEKASLARVANFIMTEVNGMYFFQNPDNSPTSTPSSSSQSVPAQEEKKETSSVTL